MAQTSYGYARVSAKDQNLARQSDAFAREGLAKKSIFPSSA